MVPERGYRVPVLNQPMLFRQLRVVTRSLAILIPSRRLESPLDPHIIPLIRSSHPKALLRSGTMATGGPDGRVITTWPPCGPGTP